MAVTEAQICNIALGRIGVREPIDDLISVGLESESCAIYYPQARDKCLELVTWKFAMRRAVLAVLSTPSVPTAYARSNWDITYAMPSDCLVPRFIVPPVQSPGPEDRIPFDWEDDAASGNAIILSDYEEAELAYTAKFTNPARFSPLFVEAVAWELAGNLALCIPNKATLAAGCFTKAKAELLSAAASQLRGAQPAKEPEADSIRVRGVRGDNFWGT